jgi:hypothetical protein
VGLDVTHAHLNSVAEITVCFSQASLHKGMSLEFYTLELRMSPPNYICMVSKRSLYVSNILGRITHLFSMYTAIFITSCWSGEGLYIDKQ